MKWWKIHAQKSEKFSQWLKQTLGISTDSSSTWIFPPAFCIKAMAFNIFTKTGSNDLDEKSGGISSSTETET